MSDTGKRCRTCRWWGGCAPGDGCCLWPKNYAKDRPDGIRLDDDDDCPVTGPDFGCIHHEEKP